MKKDNTRTLKHALILGASFFATTLSAQLSLSPNEVDLNDVMQPRQVLVTYDGKPLVPEDILSIVSGVAKTGDALPSGVTGESHFSNYSYMFEFEVGEEGLITIVPRKGLVEVGTYDLLVRSVHGTVTGVINANLRDSLPPREHEPLNLSEFSYDIKLPDYVYGQAISIELKPDSKNTYFWYVDGELELSGLGETSFRTWPEAGSHEISFIARDPDGHVVARWSDTTSISNEEAIATTVRKGYQVPFSSPPGYSKVSWYLDDKLVSEKHTGPSERDTHVVKFRSKGTHTLTCVASDSETGDFRRITWTVKVK